MKLLYPEFLYALFFLAIPIIIHLFNFRKYKVLRFSQVRFLQEIQKQTQSTSRLKHWLVLLSRCLAITALVLAFCQPYLPGTEAEPEQGKKGVSIYIDNSFSMQGKASSGQLLDLAKNKALQIIEAYSASDQFQLLTNDFEGKHQRWLNKDQFIEAIQEIEISPTFRKLDEVISRQDQLFESAETIPKRFIISDLQKSSFNLEEVADSISLKLVPLQTQVEQNLSLLSLKFNSPYRLQNRLEKLQFNTFNFSESEAESISAQLFLNEQLKSPLSIQIGASDSSITEISYRNSGKSWLRGKVVIKDYPINFDDTLYFSYPIRKQMKVLHLFGEDNNPALEHLFAKDSFVVYQKQQIKQVDLSSFASTDLIALDEVLSLSSGIQEAIQRYVESGGALVIFPSSEMELNSFNSLLAKLQCDQYLTYVKKENRITELNKQARLYQDVFEEQNDRIDLPKLSAYWKLSRKQNTLRTELLQMQTNAPFLSEYQAAAGKVYLLATSLRDEETNFSKHAIFVPTVYNMALQAKATYKSYHLIHEEEIVLQHVDNAESPVRIVGHGVDLIPPQKFTENKLKLQTTQLKLTAGHYELFRKDQKIAEVALNYHRKESDPETYTFEELEAIAERKQLDLSIFEESQEALMNRISKLEQGTPLWKYFIIFALVFLGLEVVLLRILK